jgi:hypothetical protein
VEEQPAVHLTVKQLRSLAAHRDKLSQEEQAQLDVIQEEGQAEEEEQAQQAQMDAMASLQVQPQQPQVWDDEVMVGPPLQNQLVVPQQQQQQMTGGMIGGLQIPNPFAGQPQMEGEGIVRGPTIPGMGPLIAVRTDVDAFAREGLGLDGGTRPIRRNYYRGNMGGPMGPSVDRYTPQGGGQFLSAMNGGADSPGVQQTLTVNKLE